MSRPCRWNASRSAGRDTRRRHRLRIVAIEAADRMGDLALQGVELLLVELLRPEVGHQTHHVGALARPARRRASSARRGRSRSRPRSRRRVPGPGGTPWRRRSRRRESRSPASRPRGPADRRRRTSSSSCRPWCGDTNRTRAGSSPPICAVDLHRGDRHKRRRDPRLLAAFENRHRQAPNRNVATRTTRNTSQPRHAGGCFAAGGCSAFMDGLLLVW